jgi:hypothetical protein
MAKRVGQWAYSVPFPLNINHQGASIEVPMSITLPTTTVDPVITQWDTTQVSPSGSRHLKTAAAYLKILGSGYGNASLSFPYLDLGPTNISTGSGISKTKCFTFRLRNLSSSTTRIHKMRMWCSDISDFLEPQNAKLVFDTSNIWVRNKVLPLTYLLNHNKWMPTSLPEPQNLFRQDGGYTIHGSGDTDVSQYVYVALAASGTLPLGEYGSDVIASGFRVRVSFNIDNMASMWD